MRVESLVVVGLILKVVPFDHIRFVPRLIFRKFLHLHHPHDFGDIFVESVLVLVSIGQLKKLVFFRF